MIDILENYLPLPKKISPIRAFLLCFCLGPVVLMFFYYVSITNVFPGSEYRGLFQFYSATFGDFIVLPLGWAIVSTYYHAVPRNITPPRMLTRILIPYVIGICLTIPVTLAGVYGSNRDWTLPARGVINFAGVYHSMFMALVLGTFWHFCLDHWATMRVNTTSVHDDKIIMKLNDYYWLVLNLITLFFVLLWADNIYAVRSTVASYFLSNMVEQVTWLVFLLVNVVFTIRLKLIQKNKMALWVMRQLIVVALLNGLGIILVK